MPKPLQLHYAQRNLTQGESQWAKDRAPAISRFDYEAQIQRNDLDESTLVAKVHVRYPDSSCHRYKLERVLDRNEALTQAGEIYRRWQTDLPYWADGHCLRDGWRYF